MHLLKIVMYNKKITYNKYLLCPLIFNMHHSFFFTFGINSFLH